MKRSTDDLIKILSDKRTYEEFYLEEADELQVSSLSEYLNDLLNEKQLKKSDVISKSNLDKNYAYQLFNGTKERPSRNKAIMLAFGLGLKYEETHRLLRCAGVSELYPRSPRDSLIIHCLEKGRSLITCNEFLSDFSLEILE